jgi:hypothetical protein
LTRRRFFNVIVVGFGICDRWRGLGLGNMISIGSKREGVRVKRVFSELLP